MNIRSGVFSAVKRLGGPPNRPPDAPDLFCLIAATSNVCAWTSATLAAIERATAARFMRAILVGLRMLGVIDDQHVDLVACRLELEAKLIAERLKDRRAIRWLRGPEAQVVRHPLHLPV